MTTLEIYLILMLDNVRMAFGIILCVPLIFFLTTFIVYTLSGIEDIEILNFLRSKSKPIRVLIIVSIICGLGLMTTPTTKEACAIFMVPRILNNEEFQQLPQSIIEYVNEWVIEKKEEIK